MISFSPVKLYVSDTWNFHRRNFASLFDLARQEKFDVHINRKRRSWWQLLGNYESKWHELAAHRARLEPLAPEALLDASWRGVNLFACARSEILAHVIPQNGWLDGPIPGDDDRALIAMMNACARDILLANMAAAADWLDFWAEEFTSGKRYTHCCVFSGSPIYTRTLLETCRRVGIRAFVMETFFTGHHFYCEEKFGPIANCSDLAIDNYYDAIAIPADPGDFARARADAHRAIREMRSKNVRPDEAGEAISFANRNPVAFVVGQVVNDFSIIETQTIDLNALTWMQSLTGKLLSDTDFNVVIKTHPWERNKENLRRPLTLERISEWVAGLPADQRARVAVVERPPISSIFRISSWVFIMCSQSGIEAAGAGFKPVVFGKPFYGRRGFTHSYDDIDGFVADLRGGRIKGLLNLDEYRAYETFLVKALVRHLMTNDDRGVENLRRVLTGTHGALAATTPAPAIVVTAEMRRRQNRRDFIDRACGAVRANSYAFFRDRLFNLRRRIDGRPRDGS